MKLNLLLSSFIGVVVCSSNLAVCLCSEHVREVDHEKTSRHQEWNKEMPCDLTVIGPVIMADGIGRQSIDLIDSLQPFLRISFIPTIPLQECEVSPLRQEIQKVLYRSGVQHKGRVVIYEEPLLQPPLGRPWSGDFWSRFGLLQHDPEQIRIAYSMYESSRIPREWVDILNSSFDAVAVPDPFLLQVYQESGVEIPVFVVPLGRDLHDFLSAPLKTERHFPMVFANFGACAARKNSLRLVQGFGEAFGDSPAIMLKLYWRQKWGEQYKNAIVTEIALRGLHNVYIEEGPVAFPEYFRRYMGIDCLVNISTGEGFSNQPREAMALGIPVILTNNTGQKTLCETGLVCSVPSEIEIPSQYPYPGVFGVQYDCTVEDVARAFKEMYEHYGLYLQKAKEMRLFAQRYDLSAVAGGFLNLIKPKKIILGKKNKILKNGLMTTSKRLAKKYRMLLDTKKMCQMPVRNL